MFRLFKKASSSENFRNTNDSSDLIINQASLRYAWILAGRLAIGPMPKSSEDWILLEQNGIRKRFSCCYDNEHIFTPIPKYWTSKEVPLPDHRKQEELSTSKLIYTLNEAIGLINQDSQPMYLHCYAGQERSSLIATGIVSLIEKKDLFDSLAYIRQCYPKARPLYEHLDILEQTLKEYN
jgi:hypothetical protein